MIFALLSVLWSLCAGRVECWFSGFALIVGSGAFVVCSVLGGCRPLVLFLSWSWLLCVVNCVDLSC